MARFAKEENNKPKWMSSKEFDGQRHDHEKQTSLKRKKTKLTRRHTKRQ